MLIRITRRWDGLTLHEVEAVDQKTALQELVAKGANLRGADLRGANLRDANLWDANLVDANLRGANLRGADLRGANLVDADLRGANLGDADLGGANLGGANLRGANLGGANLGGANLGGANLRRIRDDIFAVLSSAPSEAQAVLDALRAGTVDGSTYAGDCACLVGTMAKAKGCTYDALPGLTPDSGRLAEVWFTAITPGDTPENSQPAKFAAECIEDWLTRMRVAFGPTPAAA